MDENDLKVCAAFQGFLVKELGFALAEVLWTYPDPAKRDFKEFEERAANYRRRLIGAHVNCAPLK